MNNARTSHAPFALLILLLVLAGGFRLYLAREAHMPTIDTAVVGQMALDILAGDRPAFFAGQNYLGALEAYLLALVFMVVPPGRVTMTFVTIGFALAWIAITYFFFRQRHGAWAALAAASVPAFPGWPSAWYTTVPYGGYPETYFFGMVLLVMALPFLDRRDFAPSRRHALALAAVAGMAVWTNLQVAPYLAAAGLAGLWAFCRHPRPLRIWVPYGLVPLAVAAVFLPQLQQDPAQVQLPIFSRLSLAAAAHSGREFFQYDLPRSLLWTFPPQFLHILVAFLWGAVVAGGLILAFCERRRATVNPATALLVLAMVAVFSLTYFPHPLSGHVPRYFNAPLALLLGWSLAVWVNASPAWIRRAGLAAALFLAAYNATGMICAARAKEPDQRQTGARFRAAITAARDGGWDALLDTGSEVEGYEGARLNFLSSGKPVFASAFSDRFLGHQLAWEFSGRAGYLVRRGHLPFIEGSLAAMNVSNRQIRLTAHYALIDAPEVSRIQERSLIPSSIADWPGPVDRHPLFDRSAATTWPAEPDLAAHALTMQFNEPVRFVGLRTSARHPGELPFRYAVRVRRLDGTWITVQESERRIAGSYLSGTRLYFRGYHPWMDLRFDPVVGTALEWTWLEGPDDPDPPQLYDLHVLEATGRTWPEWSRIVPDIQAALEAVPDVRIIAERGVLRELHRHAGSEAFRRRLPLPYNPRFLQTQPEQFSLVEGQYVLIIEDAYRETTQAVLRKTGGTLLDARPIPPFCVLVIAIDAAASGKAAWHGFRLVESESPSP